MKLGQERLGRDDGRPGGQEWSGANSLKNGANILSLVLTKELKTYTIFLAFEKRKPLAQ